MATDDVLLLRLVSGTSSAVPTPIITSAPHFLDGDPELRSNVTGLNPVEDKHRSYMDVEPRTGSKDDKYRKYSQGILLLLVVMSGARRMQVNLNVLSDPNIT